MNMNPYMVQKIKHKLNTEAVRRMLIEYFVEKGITNFDTLLYPATIQDLPMRIPQLSTKAEITPHCQNIDAITNEAKLGWNLFVLGTQRMYLGETHHTDLVGLAQTLQSGAILNDDKNATRQTTPRRIIHFITSVLGKVEGGYCNLAPGQQAMSMDNMGNRMANQMSSSNQFFSRSTAGM